MDHGTYEEKVLPHLESIALWAAGGESRAAIARRLGVSAPAFRAYVREGRKNGRYAALTKAVEGGPDRAAGDVRTPSEVAPAGTPAAIAAETADREEPPAPPAARGQHKPAADTAAQAMPPDPRDDGADAMVERAFLDKCLGSVTSIAKNYKLKRVEYDPVTGKRVREYEELVCARDEVFVPSSTTAQMFWLTNRMGDRWQYRPRGGPSEEDGGGIIVIPPVEEDL